MCAKNYIALCSCTSERILWPGLLIADEAALKSVWEDKGASGTKLCFMCQNVVAESSQLHKMDSTSQLISHAETRKAKMVLHTDASVLKAAAHLAQQQPLMNKGAFKRRQFALGLNYTPHGSLFAPELQDHLKPVSISMFDWMHNFVVGGVFQLEMTQLLRVLKEQGIEQSRVSPDLFVEFVHIARLFSYLSYNLIRQMLYTRLLRHEFFQACSWPSFLSDKGATAKKLLAKKVTDFRSSASEALAVYPVMRSFVLDALPHIRDNDATRCCHSFFALCEVMDMLLIMSTDNAHAQADVLEQKLVTHLELFKRCHGTDKVLPKAHFNLHLPDILRRHKLLLSCFVHERRHKELKRYANEMSSMQEGSEKHILEMELEEHFKHLADFSETRHGLVRAMPAPLPVAQSFREFFNLVACPGLQFDNKCYIGNGRLCRQDDVVVLQGDTVDEVAQVWFHVAFAGHN